MFSRPGCRRMLPTFLAMLPAHHCGGAGIHVSPTGNDSNASNAESPLATAQAARDKVRGMVSKGLTEPVEVVLAAGNYTLPIPEDGTYQVSLLYPSGKDHASNVPLTAVHAGGTAELKWDMKKGSRHGFATAVGKFRFKPGGPNTVTLSTRGTDGYVIADGVAFVKVAD